MFQVHLPDGRYGEPAGRVRFHDALQEQPRSIPGVENVGAASRLPATGHYHRPWGVRGMASALFPGWSPKFLVSALEPARIVHEG